MVSDLFSVCFDFAHICRCIEQHKDFVVGMEPGDNQIRYKHYMAGVYCIIIPGTRQPSRYMEKVDLKNMLRAKLVKEKIDELLMDD